MRTGLTGSISIALTLCLAKLAAADQAYTLADCFRESVKRSMALAYQQEAITQAVELYNQGVGNLLPSINATGTYTRQDTSTAGLGASFYPAEQKTIALTATQPLFRGMREYAALYLLRDQLTAQKEAWQWARLQLFMDVAQAFYNVLAYQADLQLLDAEIAVFDERIRDLQARVRIGRSRKTEVLTMQSSQALLRNQREQVQGQLNVARATLAFVTGLAPDIALNDTQSEPVGPSVLEVYLQRIPERPDIRAARQQLEAAKTSVAISKEAHLPAIDATGNYYFLRSGVLRDVKWDVQLSVTLPVFLGGALVSKTRQTASQMRQSQENLQGLENQAQQLIRSAWDNFQSDNNQIALLLDASRIAEDNYRANLRDYDLTLVTNLDVLASLTSFQDALRSLERARFAAKADYLRLQAQVNQVPPALAPAGEDVRP